MVETISVECKNLDEMTDALCLVTSSKLPKLRELSAISRSGSPMPFWGFSRHIRRLSKTCTVNLDGGFTSVRWESLPQWINFLRSSQPTNCSLSLMEEADRVGVEGTNAGQHGHDEQLEELELVNQSGE